MKRRYVINSTRDRGYKGYSIRLHYFVPQPGGGLAFETDDPDVQRLIEASDGYGAFIHPAETPEEIAAMKEIEEKAAEPQEPEQDEAPIAVQGARGTMSNKAMRKGQIIGGKK